MISALDRLIDRLSLVLAAIAGLALIAVAFIIMAEVTMRAARAPLVGASEIARLTFVVSVYFAFAHVVTQRREIRVDLLREAFSPGVLRALDALASFVTMVFFAFILWFAIARLQQTWERGTFLDGRLLLPLWIPWLTITIGAAVTVLAAAASMVKHAAGYESGDAPRTPPSQGEAGPRTSNPSR